MIDEADVAAATRIIEKALVEYRLTWIIEAVNLKEAEIAATADLLLARKERRDALLQKVDPKKPRKRKPKEDPLPFELGDWDELSAKYRRLLLLTIAIDRYCVLPFHASRAANDTIADLLDVETNLDTEVLRRPSEDSIVQLRASVRGIEAQLIESAEDPVVLKILKRWRRR